MSLHEHPTFETPDKPVYTPEQLADAERIVEASKRDSKSTEKAPSKKGLKGVAAVALLAILGGGGFAFKEFAKDSRPSVSSIDRDTKHETYNDVFQVSADQLNDDGTLKDPADALEKWGIAPLRTTEAQGIALTTTQEDLSALGEKERVQRTTDLAGGLNIIIKNTANYLNALNQNSTDALARRISDKDSDPEDNQKLGNFNSAHIDDAIEKTMLTDFLSPDMRAELAKYVPSNPDLHAIVCPPAFGDAKNENAVLCQKANELAKAQDPNTMFNGKTDLYSVHDTVTNNAREGYRAMAAEINMGIVWFGDDKEVKQFDNFNTTVSVADDRDSKTTNLDLLPKDKIQEWFGKIS